jgi:hypothetical protein
MVVVDPGEPARLVHAASQMRLHANIVRGLPRGDVLAVVQRPVEAVDRVDGLAIQRLRRSGG